MTYSSEVLADTPTLWLRLGEAASGVASPAEDSSGNNRDGTYGTSAVIVRGEPGLLTGDADTCARSVGVEDSTPVSVPNGSWMTTNFASGEAWIRTTSLAHNNYIAGNEASAIERHRFWVSAAGHLIIQVKVGATVRQVNTASGTILTNTTYYVAWTYDGTTIRLYLNGSQVATGAWSGTIANSPQAFKVGNFGNQGVNESFVGYLDEIGLYDYALSAARVLAHYTAGTVTGDIAGALATETDTALAGSTDSGQSGQLATEIDEALAGATVEQNVYYEVDLKVGAHEFTITSADTVDPDDPIHVLDALNIAWQADESDPWPTQPDPVVATVGFITGDVDNLEDVDINTPMSAVLRDADGNIFGTFHGRVVQLDAQPIKRKSGLYTLYTVHGKDYTKDLEETPIVIPVEWPAESGDDRFARIVAAITAAGGATVEPPADCDSAAFEAYAAGTTTAGALIRDHLRQIAVPGDFGPERYLLVPVVVTDALDHFECVRLIRTVDAALLPGTLDVVGGLLTLVFPDDEADGLVPAGLVHLDSSWTRLKYRAVNRVTVTGNSVTEEASRPGVPVRLSLDTTLTDPAAAQRMAELYLPDPAENNGWVVDTLRLEAWRQPSTITPAWFPDHREDPASTSVYVMPIAVVGIAPEINLAGNQAYAGQLTNVSLTIANRRVVVDFSLRLQLPLGIGAEAASWEWLEDEHPTVTWEDVDPDLSWYEARLARRS